MKCSSEMSQAMKERNSRRILCVRVCTTPMEWVQRYLFFLQVTWRCYEHSSMLRATPRKRIAENETQWHIHQFSEPIKSAKDKHTDGCICKQVQSIRNSLQWLTNVFLVLPEIDIYKRNSYECVILHSEIIRDVAIDLMKLIIFMQRYELFGIPLHMLVQIDKSIEHLATLLPKRWRLPLSSHRTIAP